MQQKTFLLKKAVIFENNMKKEPQKPRLKLKKYGCYIYTENIYSACNLMQAVIFFKNV